MGSGDINELTGMNLYCKLGALGSNIFWPHCVRNHLVVDVYSILNINGDNLCHNPDCDFQDFSGDSSHPDIGILGQRKMGDRGTHPLPHAS